MKLEAIPHTGKKKTTLRHVKSFPLNRGVEDKYIVRAQVRSNQDPTRSKGVSLIE